MKLLPVLILTFMLFAGFKSVLLLEEEDTQLPEFNIPNFDIPFPVLELGDGLTGVLGGFFTFLWDVITWIFTQILNILLLTFLLIQLVFFLIVIMFTPITNAPFLVNFFMISFTLIGMIVMIALIRGTSSE